MSYMSRLLATAVIVCPAYVALPAAAQNPPLSLEYQPTQSQQPPRDPDGYWTPSQLQAAVAVDVLIPPYAQSIRTIGELEQTLDTMGLPRPMASPPDQDEGQGSPPVAPPDAPQANQADLLFQSGAQPQSGVMLQNSGTLGAPFSSSRFVPQSARLEYPYRVVGKLFFRTPQGSSWCSAAVLRPRLILTAGHCVHRGTGGAGGFYSNWLFVPAYENGQAPFQAWNWRYVITTGAWSSGGGTVPNAGDWALIELEDRTVGSQTMRIGQWLGSLGYHTNVLDHNHVKMVGYPGNFDSGLIPHQVDAQSFRGGGTNTWLYGSDSRGGSSGGPWVMNFGAPAAGQTGGLQPWPNRIIGVTSYGYIATGPMAQGASILNADFVNILNIACAHRANNC